MGLFGNGVAMQLARQADDKANATAALLSAAIASFKAHTEACDNNTRLLREDMQRERDSQREWRRGLGERLDSVDKMQVRATQLLITVLLSVIGSGLGFLLTHLVTK